MENLPEEVMVDILSRLPAKAIIYCKCVCKKWHNLVNDPYFINLHLSRSPTGFMVHRDPCDTPRILEWVEIEDGLDHHSLHHEPIINFDVNGYLPPAPISPTVLIPLDSVNGLMCIRQRVVEGVKVDTIYICNPITREYLTLPRPQNYGDYYALIVYKFGVNLLTGEYKVLRIFLKGPGGPLNRVLQEAEVYTLGTSQWRSLGHVPYWFDGFNGTFLNGCFHWRGYDQDVPGSIFTFDLDKETFQLFPSPPPSTEHEVKQEWLPNLGVFKGCLCKSSFYDSQLTVWVMKQYGIKESWHKELVIKQTNFFNLHIFGGLQDGSILVVSGNKALAYCPKSETFEDLAILDGYFSILNHRPSFIKLHDIDTERAHTF